MSKLKKAFLDDPDVEPAEVEAKPQSTGLRRIKGFGVPPRSRVAGASKYDLASFEIGEAFVSDSLKEIRNITVAARSYSKRAARNGGIAPKFVTRKTPDGEYALIRES